MMSASLGHSYDLESPGITLQFSLSVFIMLLPAIITAISTCAVLFDFNIILLLWIIFNVLRSSQMNKVY